ncbi:hypothetical protein J7E91_14895 [Streptomyces sp. ISL-99]|uniref:hypothetical protein n=1 Tax=Streptomyces sp. ISL-99 TaxID=2819193 RepID=UPI001BE53EE1|nr:hypothetical protein [Streptomyces sp. ISL-99]MBT2526677.1 hypothetical protein [Streptomyces sp. ISL-99]
MTRLKRYPNAPRSDFIIEVAKITKTIGAQLLWAPWSFTVMNIRTGEFACSGTALTERQAYKQAEYEIKRITKPHRQPIPNWKG